MVSSVYYVLFTVCTVTASTIMYKDWENLPAHAIGAQLASLLVLMLGVYVLQATKDTKPGCAAGRTAILVGSVASTKEVAEYVHLLPGCKPGDEGGTEGPRRGGGRDDREVGAGRRTGDVYGREAVRRRRQVPQRRGAVVGRRRVPVPVRLGIVSFGYHCVSSARDARSGASRYSTETQANGGAPAWTAAAHSSAPNASRAPPIVKPPPWIQRTTGTGLSTRLGEYTISSRPSGVVSTVVVQCLTAKRAAAPALNCTMRRRAFAPSGPASLATLSSLSSRIASQITYWRHLSTSFRCGWRQIL